MTARIVGYLAMAVLIGGLLFVSLLWPTGAGERRTRRVLMGSCVAGASAAVAQVAVVIWRADGSLTLSSVLTEDFGRARAAMVLLGCWRPSSWSAPSRAALRRYDACRGASGPSSSRLG